MPQHASVSVPDERTPSKYSCRTRPGAKLGNGHDDERLGAAQNDSASFGTTEAPDSGAEFVA